MPHFKVVVRRSFVEYGDVVIEAEDEFDAREKVEGNVDDFDFQWGNQTIDEEEIESINEE